ncbi:MAG: 2Fe-2S iron-sulfur cluster-binding protein [Clostridia bacterium]|nr:2Fe-2S iron-sulfur cluster-binding protein [Clostridia bacterium]
MIQKDRRQVIVIDILRSGRKTGDEPSLQRYSVKASEPLTVQILLRTIYHTLDQSLAFRGYSCYMGVCRSCLVRVNGMAVKSCETLVAPGEKILVEPVSGDPNKLVCDLVCHHDI